MYIGLYHTHKFMVIIFLIIYLIKIYLLLSGKSESLTTFTKRFKIPEMAVSVLFLLTGIGLLMTAAEIRPIFIGKLAAVFVAIPLAIIGFKKQNKVMASLSFILLISAYGMAEMNKKSVLTRLDLSEDIIIDVSSADYNMVTHGQALFNTQCVMCHGENGDQQMSGAKDLTVSQMESEEVLLRLNQGKLTMPPYADHFTEHEKNAIVEYVMTLRN